MGWMLWPITLSAADVLLSPDLHQLQECPGPGCGWLFLDTSKNHKRRWCTMEGCGNRAKARSQYQRKRQALKPASVRKIPPNAAQTGSGYAGSSMHDVQ